MVNLADIIQEDMAIEPRVDYSLSTPDELAPFIAVGNAVVSSARTALKSNSLTKEQYDSILLKGQEQGEILLEAKESLGRMTAAIPKATKGNQYTGKMVSPSNGRTKTETLTEINITKQQANRYEQIAAHPEAKERAKEIARANDDIVTESLVLQIIREEQKASKRQDRKERKEYSQPVSMPETCVLSVADITGGLPDIPDNSIDFIITDPPYPKEYIPLYEDLSKVASRVLKDGGSLICLVGQKYLNNTMMELGKHLQYHWIMSYLTDGGQSPVSVTVHDKVNTFWKPILWFTKGEYCGDVVGDVIKTNSNDNDKDFHHWGQNLYGFQEIVRKFTYPKQTILDPFCGGGTTGVAAVLMDRRFIGTDCDADCIATSHDRILEAINA